MLYTVPASITASNSDCGFRVPGPDGDPKARPCECWTGGAAAPIGGGGGLTHIQRILRVMTTPRSGSSGSRAPKDGPGLTSSGLGVAYWSCQKGHTRRQTAGNRAHPNGLAGLSGMNEWRAQPSTRSHQGRWGKVGSNAEAKRDGRDGGRDSEDEEMTKLKGYVHKRWKIYNRSQSSTGEPLGISETGERLAGGDARGKGSLSSRPSETTGEITPGDGCLPCRQSASS